MLYRQNHEDASKHALFYFTQEFGRKTTTRLKKKMRIRMRLGIRIRIGVRIRIRIRISYKRAFFCFT